MSQPRPLLTAVNVRHFPSGPRKTIPRPPAIHSPPLVSASMAYVDPPGTSRRNTSHCPSLYRDTPQMEPAHASSPTQATQMLCACARPSATVKLRHPFVLASRL